MSTKEKLDEIHAKIQHELKHLNTKCRCCGMHVGHDDMMRDQGIHFACLSVHVTLHSRFGGESAVGCRQYDPGKESK